MCYYETYCRHCADRSTHRRAGAFRQSDASAIRFTVGTSGRHGWRNRNGLSSVRHGQAARGQYGTATRESSLAHPDETDPAKPRKATVQAETDVQMESETADRTTEVSQTEQVEEKKPSGGINILRLSVGVLFLAVAVFVIWIFYKRIKR